jgi:hypothetical protein
MSMILTGCALVTLCANNATVHTMLALPTTALLTSATAQGSPFPQGVGARWRAAQVAVQAPRAVLQPTITAGMPAPAVTVPIVNPAAA